MNIIIDTTLERDMDLLIMEEFISSPVFAKIFTDVVGIEQPYHIEQASHSVRDADLGESDIVFILNIDGHLHGLHIEDKVDAQAMPDQHGRYELRAQKDIVAGKYESYSVLIVAPAKYLETNAEAKKYAHHVQYEQLRKYFADKTDPRSQFKLSIIDRAIYEQKSGYQWEANPGVVRFCTAMAERQKKAYPGLPVGSTAWWPTYPTLLKDTAIVFKANKGFCDLQFGHTLAQDLYARVKDYLSERMTVVQANKSASVRIAVSPIWFEHDFEDNISEVDEALSALNELYELSKKLLA